jgi:tetratricopeptide (TPR) repeat protein
VTRGREHLAKRRWLQAVGDFTQALKLNPKSAPIYALRGSAYRQSGTDQQLSLIGLAAVMGTKPNYSSVRLKYHWSIVDFTRSIALDPKNAYLLYQRGQTYSARGDLPGGELNDFSRAASDFSDAIALNPKVRNFYQERAMAYRKQGLVDKAIADEQAAQNLG